MAVNGHRQPAGAIDQAVAATEAAPAERRAELQVRLMTGRLVAINVPVDLDANEAVGLIGYVAVQLPAELAKFRAKTSPIIVPAHAIGRI